MFKQPKFQVRNGSLYWCCEFRCPYLPQPHWLFCDVSSGNVEVQDYDPANNPDDDLAWFDSVDAAVKTWNSELSKDGTRLHNELVASSAAFKDYVINNT